VLATFDLAIIRSLFSPMLETTVRRSLQLICFARTLKFRTCYTAELQLGNNL
jgi:hypothetical protein